MVHLEAYLDPDPQVSLSAVGMLVVEPQGISETPCTSTTQTSFLDMVVLMSSVIKVQA